MASARSIMKARSSRSDCAFSTRSCSEPPASSAARFSLGIDDSARTVASLKLTMIFDMSSRFFRSAVKRELSRTA